MKRSVSVMIEGDKALATLSESAYDDNGSTDAAHFSHLNVKQSKGYHYKSISVSTAESASLETLAGLFASDTPATLSETDYTYNADYKARGIPSLPTESRVLNPANPSEILARTQTVYDNQIPSANSNYTYSAETYGITASEYDCSNNATPKICWQNPNSTRLGRATTSRLWDKDTDTWIESHTKYDIFGNAVKAKDAIGNEASTIFTATNKYAYPETVITPAPDPTNTTGTSATSQASTTYDFMTGLPLSVTDDFGRITKTEYNDSLLRPTRTFADNFTAPEAQTIYDDTPAVLMINGVDVGDGDPISVKVRKQIDATNWDEAETFADSLGRTVKSQAKDSQGDVFVETEYDLLGRVKRTTNPYRLTDLESGGVGKIWSNPRYDALGRVYETCAAVSNSLSNPNAACPTGTSTGITSFAISEVTGFVGTVVTSTDASGRKSRSITNGLGQLIRIDEATATGGTEDADLGTLASPNQPTFYNYAPQGQMVKVQQGGQNRYFLYDSLGRLIRVRQPEQEVNSPQLDKTDSITGNNQWTAGFTYDVVGNVITTTDAKGTVITNEYDKAGRVTKRMYSDGTTPQVEYLYDGFLVAGQPPTASPNYAKGKLTHVSNGISQTRYLTFDTLGRLTSSEQKTPVEGETMTTAPARVSQYEYNFEGALIKETYPSGRTVENQFEADGDLMRVFGKANSGATEKTYANSFSYTASGGISQIKLGNGRWETAKFNERLQLTELGLGFSSADASLWKVNYDYGELESGTVNANKNTGNIARQTLSFAGLQNPIVQNYKYDSLERLIEAKETSGTATNAPQNWIQNFGYDRFGNRTSFSQQIGQTTINQTPTIDANTNRFAANQAYIYDKNGNVINDLDPLTSQLRTFIFNGENKQTEVKNSSGATIGRYFYDGEGNRIKKETATETTVFVYSSGKLIAEYSTQITPQNERTTSYITEDQLGSPRVITDALGQVKSRRDFMPFGEDLTINVGARSAAQKYGTSDNIRQKFTGYEKDTETQLDFAEARMYENRHGRFTAVDPLLASGKSANPQTFNRFVYVGNNPINITDPLGLDWYSQYNSETKKTTYQWSADNKTFDDGSKVEGWTPVDFGGNPYIVLNNISYGGTQFNFPVYLYKSGSWDFGSWANIRYGDGRVPLFGESYSDFAYNSFVGRLKGTGNFFGGATNLVTDTGTFFGVGPSIRDLTGVGFNRFQYDTNSQAYFGHTTEAGWMIGTAAIGGGASVPAKSNNFVNLANSSRTAHILKGDLTGGGHAWFASVRSFTNGLLGRKSMFPAKWSQEKIMHAISDIATNPSNRWVQQTGRTGSRFTRSGQPVRFKVEGVYEGVKIRVITTSDEIITAFPIR